ncbi:MAG: hypothetical protein ACI4JF_02365 [Oscillospiraceae bacterium]
MKKYITFAAALLTAAALTGCGDYHPVNSPRSTQTMTSNILTTVTAAETTRPETYSEYISSLKAMNDGILPDEPDGIVTETGILPDNTLPISAETAVSGIEPALPEKLPSETALTTVSVPPAETSAPDEAQPESVTAICETVAPISLDDIPPVPSEAVRRSGE